MVILKTLVGFVLLSSSLLAEGEDGWFSVEETPRTYEQAEENDPSIWVFFSKNLGKEKILVQFPAEPMYLYTEVGNLEIVSEREGEVLQLTIQRSGLESIPIGDFFYSWEGKWVREHIVKTPHHLYRFKTVSPAPDSVSHRTFISSFSIEKSI